MEPGDGRNGPRWTDRVCWTASKISFVLSISLSLPSLCVCISLCTHIRSNFLSGSRLTLYICTPDDLYSSLGPAPNSFPFVFSFILDVVRIISGRRRRLYTTKWYWGQKVMAPVSLCHSPPPWWWRSYIIIIQHCICCCCARMNLFSLLFWQMSSSTHGRVRKKETDPQYTVGQFFLPVRLCPVRRIS